MDPNDGQSDEFEATPDKLGRLPIHVVCESETNPENIIKLVTVYKNQVATQNSYTRMLPLHYACQNPNRTPAVIELLLKLNEKAISTADKNKLLPIHFAAASKVVDDGVIRVLLEKYPEGAAIPEGNGRLPLHIACQNPASTAEAIKALVEYNKQAISVGDPSNKNNTAMHYVLSNIEDMNSLAKVRVILSISSHAGTKKNEDGITPIMMAEKAGKLDCLVYLWGIIAANKTLKVKDDETYFWVGMRHANSVLVNACIQKDGSLVERQTPHGIRPLQYAISEGHKNLFELLLTHIAKFDKFHYLLTAPNKDSKERTPIQLAVSSGRSDMLGTLMQYPEIVDDSEPRKLDLLTESVKAKDKSSMLIIINTFKWGSKPVTVKSTKTGLENSTSQEIELKVVTDDDLDKNTPVEAKIHWDLSNQSLDSLILPDEISRLNIRSVDLSNNEFTAIPTDLLKIASLNSIKMNNNVVNSIAAKVIGEFRKHQEIRDVDLTRNRLQAIPPELYSLSRCSFNTTGNPLAGGLVFPAWFFGISFGENNRAVLQLLDVLFVSLGFFIVFFGWILRDREELEYILYPLFIVFFGLFVAGAAYFGLYGIGWTDSLFASDEEDEEEEEEEKEEDEDEVEEEEAEEKEAEEKEGEENQAQSTTVKVESSAIQGMMASSSNIFAVISLMFEFPVLFAFSFSISIPWPEFATSAMQFFLLNWNKFDTSGDFSVFGFHIGLWVAIVLVIVQRVLLELSRYPIFGGFAATILAFTINVTSLPMFVQLTKSLLCTYGNSGSFLLEDIHPGNIPCFSGQHLVYSSLSLLAFMVYFPSAVLSVPVWQYRSKNLAIKFPSYILILTMQVKFLLALLTAMFSEFPILYLIANSVLTLGLFLLILSLKTTLQNPENTQEIYDLQLTKTKIKLGRLASYLAVWIGSIFAIITFGVDDESASIVLFVLMVVLQIGVGVGTLVVVKVAGYRHKRGLGFCFFFPPRQMDTPLENGDVSQEKGAIGDSL